MYKIYTNILNIFIDKKLKNFTKKYENLKNKKFKNFHMFEVYCCNLLNEGNSIRKYLINHTFLCSEGTIKVLTNQTRDTSLLEERFKPLFYILDLTKQLVIEYEKYSKISLDNKNYDEAIRIYNQIYFFTGNYLYKMNIAQIYLKILKQPLKSLEIYKEIENSAGESIEFLWGIADVYWELKDYYTQVKYMQKAVEIEMKCIEGGSSD